MKNAISLYLVLFALMIAAGQVSAQMSITKSDIDAAFINSSQFQSRDSTTAILNLGNGTSGQTWNYTGLNFNSTTIQRDTSNYYAAAGHVGFDHFSSAVICGTAKAINPVNHTGDTSLVIEYAQYITTQANGAYVLGIAEHVYFVPGEPPAFTSLYPRDTTIYVVGHPAELALPLPVTNSGASFTSVDTVAESSFLNSHPKTTVTTITYTLSGEGTVMLPGGISFQAVRIIQDEIDVTTSTGSYDRSHKKKVLFYGQDLRTFQYSVDTSFTSGSTHPFDWSYQKRAGIATGVKQPSSAAPETFSLNQNFPNPFNPSTKIQYTLPEQANVSLKIYNVFGQEVATLVNGLQEAGDKSVEWNAGGVSSGVYFYRIQVVSSGAKQFSQMRKMVLIK